MARPLRNTDPSYIRLFTIRTFEQRFFLQASEKTNETIGGVIARYQEKYGIEIFAYNVLSNHMHLLVRAPKQNLWKFAQEVDREIAQRINKQLGRTGFFWQRRYDEQACLNDTDALEAMLYILCNPVSHGLVKHAAHWPGISSYRYGILGKDKTFSFTHFDKYNKAKRRAKKGEVVNLRDFQTEHTLTVSRLPLFEGLDEEAYRKKIIALTEEREARLEKERSEHGLGFLGRKKVLQQSPLASPSKSKKSDRPLCYTKCLEAKREFMQWYFAWIAHYKKASIELRKGIWDTLFPEHCLKPPLHYLLC